MRLLLVFCLLSTSLLSAPRPNILFLIGDNWQYDHAGANGDPAVHTPVFDRIAREGMRFTRTFCPVPSCSPTRSSLLTGRAAHQLEDAASLWSKFPGKFRVFPDALSDAGYHVGFTGKGWSPGNYKDFGRSENPAGKSYQGLPEFLDARDAGKPFFFWLGSVHTSLHQWKDLAGEDITVDPTKVRVPPTLPDTPEVRLDIARYLTMVQKMDSAFGEAIAQIEKLGELDNTIIIYTSDNGWQMPRGLANCHDTGTRVPLAVRWTGKVTPGTVSDAFVNLNDFAPTFLEIAGAKPWPEITARSFLDVLTGQSDGRERDHIFLERERHANVRRGDLSYPCRAIRTADFLYIRNLRPDRWPAGDPELYVAVGPFGDVDGSQVKAHILDHRDEPSMKPFYDLSFAKRPLEELYDLRSDPGQVKNIAADPAMAKTKAELAARVDLWMHQTTDPRVDPAFDGWDRYPYFGGRAKVPAAR